MVVKQYEKGQKVCLDGLHDVKYFGPSYMEVRGKSRNVGHCSIRRDGRSILEEHFVYDRRVPEVIVHDENISDEYEVLNSFLLS
jgi:hypothetical protein